MTKALKILTWFLLGLMTVGVLALAADDELTGMTGIMYVFLTAQFIMTLISLEKK
jgi:hypothetical protein